ncbi:DUF922 domain-containing protein [Siccationidurans ginsengisoli]|uniref:DUF922 domain-containing protein n=1 Tax=Hymenobacter TaxID=89966 RepID=UPI001AAD3013|nr:MULTISPECIES: DUF922 domain-containing protein [unclassified Hymenobacter]MBO2031806.1 DUF922 domain-containing protein [Hymenobacter sp. BT559]
MPISWWKALAFLLLGAGPVAAQQVKLPPGSIRWSATRPLTVADFKGRPRPNQGHAALTSANINTGATCRGNIFAGTAQASFDPASSWVREPRTITPALLRHEQLHFDIAEVYARRLRQQLAAMHTTCDRLGTTFDRISQAAYAAWQEAEDAYDRDTNHGLQHERQAQWEVQVRQQLQELAAFAEKDA